MLKILDREPYLGQGGIYPIPLYNIMHARPVKLCRRKNMCARSGYFRYVDDLGVFFFFVFVSHNIIELYLFMLVAIAHFLSAAAAATRCPNTSQNSQFVKFVFFFFIITCWNPTFTISWRIFVIPTSGPVRLEEEIEGDHYRFINRHRLAV